MSFFFFKQKTAYEMRISDWSSDVCSSDLAARVGLERGEVGTRAGLGIAFAPEHGAFGDTLEMPRLLLGRSMAQQRGRDGDADDRMVGRRIVAEVFLHYIALTRRPSEAVILLGPGQRGTTRPPHPPPANREFR